MSSGRQVFSDVEKVSLQELIIKYKLNKNTTGGGLTTNTKKNAWICLTEEYNSIEGNTKRTEAQLKKCWDNLKTRQKTILMNEKKERMKTRGGRHTEAPSTSSSNILISEALMEQTDVEIDVMEEIEPPEYTPKVVVEVVEERKTSVNTDRVENNSPPHATAPPRRHSATRHTPFRECTPPQGSSNLSNRVIQQEFDLREKNYTRAQEREEELHNLKLKEKEWLVMAAEQNYLKEQLQKEAAAELLAANKAKRQLAEYELEIKKTKK